MGWEEVDSRARGPGTWEEHGVYGHRGQAQGSRPSILKPTFHISRRPGPCRDGVKRWLASTTLVRTFSGSQVEFQEGVFETDAKAACIPQAKQALHTRLKAAVGHVFSQANSFEFAWVWAGF
jgi:hypothetical protein